MWEAWKPPNHPVTLALLPTFSLKVPRRRVSGRELVCGDQMQLGQRKPLFPVSTGAPYTHTHTHARTHTRTHTHAHPRMQMITAEPSLVKLDRK